jgi:hypothetical protein
MNLRRLIGRLLAVFVIVGLVGAPLAIPAAAKRLPVGEMSDMSAMPGDMPCCPDGQGQKNKDCPDCPLVAMCMMTMAPVEPFPTNAIQVAFQTRRLSYALVDLFADGLTGAPPDHPPRILT